MPRPVIGNGVSRREPEDDSIHPIAVEYPMHRRAILLRLGWGKFIKDMKYVQSFHDQVSFLTPAKPTFKLCGQ